MSKLSYPLKKYIKAVESIAQEKGLADVRITPNKGSVVRFELYEKGESIPMSIWIIHHSHNRKKEIWSKEDYKKAARNLNCEYDFLMERIKNS